MVSSQLPIAEVSLTPRPLGPTFHFFGPDHLAALALIALATALAIVATRRTGITPRVLWSMRAVSLLLVLNFLVWQGQIIWRGAWEWSDSLPLHLCDAAHFAAMLALWRPTRLRFELVYFWGLAGAVQALLTPNITRGFPHYDYFQFFVTHGCIVGAAAFMAVGLRMTPRKGALLRIILATHLFAILPAVANILTGGNYLFLCHPPPTGSLLDHLGPWPWYLIPAEAIALVSFVLLNLPFQARDRSAWPMSSKS